MQLEAADTYDAQYESWSETLLKPYDWWQMGWSQLSRPGNVSEAVTVACKVALYILATPYCLASLAISYLISLVEKETYQIPSSLKNLHCRGGVRISENTANQPFIYGSKVKATRELPLNSSIQTIRWDSFMGTLKIVQGDEPKLTVLTDRNIITSFLPEINKNELIIHQKNGCYSYQHPVQFTLAIPRPETVSSPEFALSDPVVIQLPTTNTKTQKNSQWF